MVSDRESALVELSVEADFLLIKEGIGRLKDCSRCGAELVQRIEIAPTGSEGRHELWAIAFNCAYCLQQHVVWKKPGRT